MWNHLGRKRPSVSVHVLCPLSSSLLSCEWSAMHGHMMSPLPGWEADMLPATRTLIYHLLLVFTAGNSLHCHSLLIGCSPCHEAKLDTESVLQLHIYQSLLASLFVVVKEPSAERFALVILWGRMGCIPIVVCFNYLKLAARRKWAINVDLKGKKWVYLMWISVYSRTVQSSSLTRVQQSWSCH